MNQVIVKPENSLSGVADVTEQVHSSVQEWYRNNDGRCYKSMEELLAALDASRYHLFVMDHASSTSEDRKWIRLRTYVSLKWAIYRIEKIRQEKEKILLPTYYEEFRLEEREYLILYPLYNGEREWLQFSGSGLVFTRATVDATKIRKNWLAK